MTEEMNLNEAPQSQASVARKTWETPAYETLSAGAAEVAAAGANDGGGSS